MIEVHFNNVGQGDSIILEWSKEGKTHIGIIDCNIIDGKNPTLDFLKSKDFFVFEFIILSHFHIDHFLGMADIFKYCNDNDIKVNYFYHTITLSVVTIYDRIFTQKRIEKEVEKFLKIYDEFDKNIENDVIAQSHISTLYLTEKISLSFLAPVGKIYKEMSKQLSRKVNRVTTTTADINKFATIVFIQNETQCILLTSDAVKKSFVKIRKFINSEIVLAQAPHHGSWRNIDEIFWKNLQKKEKVPIVFSVGDEPKDKLPNVEAVSFFSNNQFDIYSTNSVYGISSFFNLKSESNNVNNKSKILNTFSKLRQSNSTSGISKKYSGNQSFKLFKNP